MTTKVGAGIGRPFCHAMLGSVFMGVLLFAAAGTVRWPAGWVFLLEIAIGGAATESWLARHDPALLAERRSTLVRNDQAAPDRILMRAIPVLWIVWLPVMAANAVRWKTSLVPFQLQITGFLLLAASFFLVYRTYRANSFASPVVRIQHEREQRVVSSGPYRFIRHPIYASGILSYIGTPLLLGSSLGLAIVPVMVVLLGIRVVIEERILTAGLDGYRDYVTRVRYRLIPAIW